MAADKRKNFGEKALHCKLVLQWLRRKKLIGMVLQTQVSVYKERPEYLK